MSNKCAMIHDFHFEGLVGTRSLEVKVVKNMFSYMFHWFGTYSLLLTILSTNCLPLDENEDTKLPFDCGIFPEKDFGGDPVILSMSQKIEFNSDTKALFGKESVSVLLSENCSAVLCMSQNDNTSTTCNELTETKTEISINHELQSFSNAACYCTLNNQSIKRKSPETTKDCAVIYNGWHYSGKKTQVRHAGSTGRTRASFGSVTVRPECSISFWSSLHHNMQFSFVLDKSTTFIKNNENDTQLWYCCSCDSCSEKVCKNARDEINNDEEDDNEYDFAQFVDYTRKIIGVGRNYRWKKSELSKVLKEPDAPIIFMKPTSSFIEEGTLLKLPNNLGPIFYELELGVVIGKRGKNVLEEDALEHVAGYFLTLDMTAKEYLKKAIAEGRPWELGKGFDFGCPVSSFIPKRLVPDPNKLQLTCKVNGNITQHESTGNMIFNVRQLIAYISKFMTLEPYDVILTGTPDGFGALAPGDFVEGEVDDLMTIRFDAA